MKMTTKQYAAARGITEGAVRKAIKLGHALPGVTKREKFGRVHVLYVTFKKADPWPVTPLRRGV